MQEPAAGLFYARVRYYDGVTARFLSRDPVFSPAPREMDPYQYAAGDPVGNIDPMGLKTDSIPSPPGFPTTPTALLFVLQFTPTSVTPRHEFPRTPIPPKPNPQATSVVFSQFASAILPTPSPYFGDIHIPIETPAQPVEAVCEIDLLRPPGADSYLERIVLDLAARRNSHIPEPCGISSSVGACGIGLACPGLIPHP